MTEKRPTFCRYWFRHCRGWRHLHFPLMFSKLSLCVCVFVWVSVCVREREREREDIMLVCLCSWLFTICFTFSENVTAFCTASQCWQPHNETWQQLPLWKQEEEGERWRRCSVQGGCDYWWCQECWHRCKGKEESLCQMSIFKDGRFLVNDWLCHLDLLQINDDYK